MGCRHVTDRASVVGPTLLSLHDPTTRLHSARSGLHACIERHRQAAPDPPCFTLGEACRHVERCGTVTVACQYGGHAQRVAAVQVPPSHVPPSYNLQVPPSHVVPEFNQSRSGERERERERLLVVGKPRTQIRARGKGATSSWSLPPGPLDPSPHAAAYK
jgi:hypothetical protein